MWRWIQQLLEYIWTLLLTLFEQSISSRPPHRFRLSQAPVMFSNAARHHLPGRSLPSPANEWSTSSPYYGLTNKCKYTLILDLDETLCHTSVKPVTNYPDSRKVLVNHKGEEWREFYILRRPYLDFFLTELSKYFKLVVFTASIRVYADAVIDLIDTYSVISERYFRVQCTNHNGQYVKDLSRVSTDLKKTIIIDNSPVSYGMHPENAIPITTWIDNPHDAELLNLVTFLKALAEVSDVRSVLGMRTGLGKSPGKW